MALTQESRIPGKPDSFRKVTIAVDGRAVPAREGEPLLAALVAAGIRILCENDHGLRSGAYCAMGICYCCAVEVDGVGKQRACLVPVREEMRVRTCRSGPGEEMKLS